jgi:hypothetical protein
LLVGTLQVNRIREGEREGGEREREREKKKRER